ncbi:MAG: response regulator [bacterium]|nr:response regulator [bacterium]
MKMEEYQEHLERLIQRIRAGDAAGAEALVLQMQPCRNQLDALSKENERLEEAERMRTRFLALISHELRTPLNAIIGYNSLLEDGVYGDLNDRQRKAARRIDRNATRLLTLINQLLDLSRLEAGVTAVFHEKTDVKKIVDDVIGDYQVVAEEKGVELLVTQPRREVAAVTDPDKFREILRQLISNAVKFTDRGSVTVVIRIIDRSVVIEVADSGPGIEASRREAVFRLFERDDNAPASPVEGAGLGLAIVRRLADLLKIGVSLQSEPGGGSVFRLALPLECDRATAEPHEEPQPAAPPEPAQEAAIADFDTGSQSVLIVDDDPYTVELLSDFLETRGHYHVHKVYSGAHAMLRLTEQRPDYLLVDLLMPNIKGERVIEYCAQMWGAQVMIVVITGKNLEPGERERLLAQGVSDIILKGDLRDRAMLSTLERIIPIPSVAP